MTVDTEKYLDFVNGVTSFPSQDLPALLARASELGKLVTPATKSRYLSVSTVIVD